MTPQKTKRSKGTYDELRQKWLMYEGLKRDLERKDLDPDQYDLELAKIVKLCRV